MLKSASFAVSRIGCFGLWMLFLLAPVFAVGHGTAAEQQNPSNAGSAERPQTTPEFDHMQERTIELVNDAGQVLPVVARIADEPQEQAAGFQFIAPEVIAHSQILFVFADDRLSRFHMRNVEAPLDIAFIASDGTFLDIELMQPDPSPPGRFQHLYGPDRPFRLALEARAGFFKEHQLSAGKARLLVK
jgi:uncharacterized membrane protein (UPF0127 family)